MSIRLEIAIRKRKCHICDSVINKGEKYIRLSSNYKEIKANENDNYNTGSNMCIKCIPNKIKKKLKEKGWQKKFKKEGEKLGLKVGFVELKDNKRK